MTPSSPSRRRARVAPAAIAGVAALTIGLLLAACSAGSAQNAQTSRPATAQAAPPSGAPPVSSAVGSPSSAAPTDSPEPSVDSHGVPALEKLLPAKVGSVALERLSLRGPDFYALGTPTTQSQLDAMLKNLGKTVADLSVADAGDPTGLTVVEVGAFRVAGAKPDQLLSEWVASQQASNPGNITVSNEQIDGRTVTKLVDQTRDQGSTTRAFVKDDVIFLVNADDPALVASALDQLPRP